MTRFHNLKESLEFFKSLKERMEDGKSNYRLIYIDEVKIRNGITKKTNTIKDLYFLAGSNTSNVYFVPKVEIDEEVYRVHNDLNHINICPSPSNIGLSIQKPSGGYDELYFEVRTFCNPILGSSLYTYPDKYSKLLKGYLSSQNGEDRYRSTTTIDVEGLMPPLKSTSGEVITYKEVTPIVALMRVKPRYLKNMNMATCAEKLREVQSKMKDTDLFAYCYNRSNVRVEYSIVSETEMKASLEDPFHANKYISDQYPIFTRKDFEDLKIEIPIEEKDSLFIGAGSANSGIALSLGRSTYLGARITVIDPDTIEAKNLRNQIYTRGGIGCAKVTGFSDKLKSMTTDTRYITTVRDKFQNANIKYDKYKYIYCGLDSIKARQDLLKSIFEDEIKGKYLIDTRYKDQTSSLYFIDLEDKEQVDYYKTNLDEDGRLLEQEETKRIPLSDDEIARYEREMICGRCSEITNSLIRENIPEELKEKYSCDLNLCGDYCFVCGRQQCRDFIREALRAVRVPEEESTCLKQNIIGIYNFTGSYVFQLVKMVETFNKKIATHVELSCDTIPRAMIVRK